MNITPPHLRCGMGSCPSVHVLEDGDYTPEHLRCAVSISCPGVRGHNGRLTIVGRKADDIAKELGLGVGPDEAVIEIGEEYFSALPELVRLLARIERLEKALRPFVDDWGMAIQAKPWIADWPKNDPLSVNTNVEHLNYALEVMYPGQIDLSQEKETA